MKQLMTPHGLKMLGFTEEKRQPLDNGDYFREFNLTKNHSQLQIRYEYTANDDFVLQTIDFNLETLKGKTPTVTDLVTLISLM